MPQANSGNSTTARFSKSEKSQSAILIATRIYALDDAAGVEYEARDYLYRLACGAFALKLTSDLPGEPEDVKTYSLQEVFAWLNELPWQIKRAVYA